MSGIEQTAEHLNPQIGYNNLNILVRHVFFIGNFSCLLPAIASSTGLSTMFTSEAISLSIIRPFSELTNASDNP